MTHLQAIESELSMCVDELNVLQAGRVDVQTFGMYSFKLMQVTLELSYLIANVQKDKIMSVNIQNFVLLPIYNLILEATGVFNKLNISRPSGWKSALVEINNVRRVSSILGHAPGQIGAICRILAAKTTVEEKVFLSTLPHNRDNIMCSILQSISTALSALNTEAGGNYFDFLGEKGSKNMLMIIKHLA
jgi:hypothetical protein